MEMVGPLILIIQNDCWTSFPKKIIHNSDWWLYFFLDENYPVKGGWTDWMSWLSMHSEPCKFCFLIKNLICFWKGKKYHAFIFIWWMHLSFIFIWWMHLSNTDFVHILRPLPLCSRLFILVQVILRIVFGSKLILGAIFSRVLFFWKKKWVWIRINF